MAELVLSGVAQAYGRRAVITGLSLRLESGEIGCLLGPSGCGKTTALRCIAGFEPVQAGCIRIDGVPISQPGHSVPAEQRQVGMVFQDYALFSHLTVAQNVAFGLHRRSRAQVAARVDELLALVGLALHAHKYPHLLSGGQQQRVALARALAPQPRLLLMDEPFSNLDVALRERLSIEVRDILKREACTALIVTHDQHEAFALADRVGVLHQGCLQQWDTPYNLYHQPANRFVADFIGQGALLAGEAVDAQHIRTELGLLPCPLGDLGAVNVSTPAAKVDVLLRPDDIVHDDASPLCAEVVHKAFRGADFLYTLQLASGQRVLSLVPSHHNHAVGTSIGIRLAADHVVAFWRR